MQSTFLMNKVRGKKNYTYIGSCNVHSYWYTVHSLKLSLVFKIKYEIFKYMYSGKVNMCGFDL